MPVSSVERTPTRRATPSPSPPPAARGLGLLLLACAGVVMQISWTMLWPLSYRLTHGNDFTYTYLITHDGIWWKLYDLLLLENRLSPGIEPPPNVDILVYALVITFVVGSLGYLGGVVLIDRGVAPARGALWLVLGFGLVFQVTLFLMPGVFTTDIFSYVMYGHISAIYGFNPYIYPPSAFPANPLLNWIHPIWHNTPSVYGPLWTDIGWVMAWLIQPLSLMERVFAYKLLMWLVHLVNLGLVWWLLGRIRLQGATNGARVAAFTVFAWNPLVLFDVVGNAHNDGLMVTFLLLGLVPLVGTLERGRRAGAVRVGQSPSNRSWVLAMIAIALSALVKYTTALVGVFFAVAWAARLRSWRSRIAWIGGTTLLGLGLALVLYWPWLKLPEALGPLLDAAGGKLYSNSLPDLLALTIADQVIDPVQLQPDATHDLVRFWMKAVTRGIYLVYLGWEIVRLWRRAAGDTRTMLRAVLETSVRALLVLLLLVLMWVLEWYFIWPLALATLLGWRSMLTKVAVGYSLTSLPVIYVHHYWSWHMPGWVLFFYVVPPLLVPLGDWLVKRRSPSAPRTTPAENRDLDHLAVETSVAGGDA